MPNEETVVWPEDPLEADARAAEAEPEPPSVAHPAPAPQSSWPATFEEALKESPEAPATAARAGAAPAPETNAAAVVPPGASDYPTEHAMPAMPAKTVPPAAPAPVLTKTVPPPVKTAPSIPIAAAVQDPPTSSFSAQPPVAGGEEVVANGDEPSSTEAPTAPPVVAKVEPAGESAAAEPQVEEVPEPVAARAPAEGAEDQDAEPAAASAESEAEEAPEVETVSAPESHVAEPEAPAAETQPEAVPIPEPEPAPEPAPEPVMASAALESQPAAEAPAPAPAPTPEPEPAKDEEWIPAPVNPPVPSWAPKLVAEPAAENIQWPGSNLPSWAPIGGGRSTRDMPAAERSAPKPSIPIGEALPQGRPTSAAPSQPPAASASPSQPPRPAAPGTAGGSKPRTSSSWEVVQQKQAETAKQAWVEPSAEDRSYAEWFAWAKRSGAPASACHAAAQGAFRALAAGQDMNTAVQWATLAMASPPGLVGTARQLYCAWYSLGNIDLKLPTPQAHAFAAGAIKALDGGADAPTAHQAGLAAAGITG
jgi:hypothetical protein